MNGPKNPCNLDRGRKSNFCDISFDFKQKYEKKTNISGYILKILNNLIKVYKNEGKGTNIKGLKMET